MKVFILTLLVLNIMCFALGDEEKNFIDLDERNEQPAMKDNDETNDFVENENDMTEPEDEEGEQEDEESDDEPEDPEGFKDDDVDLDNASNNQTKPILEPTILPPTDSAAGSGMADEEMMNDEDLKSSLEDKLGLK